jgi:hypothetical protein
MRGPAFQHSDTPSPDDCAKSAGPRGRRSDCSVLTKNGPQFAPSSMNSELNQSAHGRAADQGEGDDGHHVGLDRRLPSHGRDFKPKRKGRRINVYLIRRPFPFTRSTRSALQSEDYGHPGGHLGRRARPELRRHSTNELSDKPGAVHFCPIDPVILGRSPCLRG